MGASYIPPTKQQPSPPPQQLHPLLQQPSSPLQPPPVGATVTLQAQSRSTEWRRRVLAKDILGTLLPCQRQRHGEKENWKRKASLYRRNLEGLNVVVYAANLRMQPQAIPSSKGRYTVHRPTLNCGKNSGYNKKELQQRQMEQRCQPLLQSEHLVNYSELFSFKKKKLQN